MICAWKELMEVLPVWMRKDLVKQNQDFLRELRLRVQAPPELVFSENSQWLERCITQDDINYTVNASSRYSPWAAASVSKGYITVTGGHRIGICGEAVSQQGVVTGMKHITSLCVRIARDFPGIASAFKKENGSVLILGPPGWGKTTFLRDLIRQLAETAQVCVVDERGELFPEFFSRGKKLDVLLGCSKKEGISMMLRTMGPQYIAVDEITDPEDTKALLMAANCGVRLLATAHAGSFSEFKQRQVYQGLLGNHIFDIVVILKKNKTYTIERM